VGAFALVGAPLGERALSFLKPTEMKNLTFISFGNKLRSYSPTTA